MVTKPFLPDFSFKELSEYTINDDCADTKSTRSRNTQKRLTTSLSKITLIESDTIDKEDNLDEKIEIIDENAMAEMLITECGFDADFVRTILNWRRPEYYEETDTKSVKVYLQPIRVDEFQLDAMDIIRQQTQIDEEKEPSDNDEDIEQRDRLNERVNKHADNINNEEYVPARQITKSTKENDSNSEENQKYYALVVTVASEEAYKRDIDCQENNQKRGQAEELEQRIDKRENKDGHEKKAREFQLENSFEEINNDESHLQNRDKRDVIDEEKTGAEIYEQENYNAEIYGDESPEAEDIYEYEQELYNAGEGDQEYNSAEKSKLGINKRNEHVKKSCRVDKYDPEDCYAEEYIEEIYQEANTEEERNNNKLIIEIDKEAAPEATQMTNKIRQKISRLEIAPNNRRKVKQKDKIEAGKIDKETAPEATQLTNKIREILAEIDKETAPEATQLTNKIREKLAGSKLPQLAAAK
ncbi:Oidioi.mRNA.OKI2018_I69.PAR.g13229.t1.cds [Oikopleura dioica]|uniref:Oidioi.mRNA.OKI2018_I69.PAR.g13229.t1.cds n=1 Tax=Oikopleura dioica TaxID=34765 RepID=A0ABN7S8D4_OIKDI|nr:Oidioi.mRNA.OKI2018_I69.PAR.g13229.t1.cds [Oikopleura dioica]